MRRVAAPSLNFLLRILKPCAMCILAENRTRDNQPESRLQRFRRFMRDSRQDPARKPPWCAFIVSKKIYSPRAGMAPGQDVYNSKPGFSGSRRIKNSRANPK